MNNRAISLKLGLFVLVLIGSIKMSISQTVRVMDESVTEIVLDSIAGENREFLCSFKLKNCSNADKLVLQIGTANDLSNVKLIEASFSYNSEQGGYGENGCELIYEGISSAIHNYDISFNFSLTESENQNAQVVTFYILQNDGSITAKKYLTL